MKNSEQADTYTEAETEARREAALKRMLATPHKPHKPKPTRENRDASAEVKHHPHTG